ncbi:hypothetical protein ACHWQZ_G005263 [Mnemiopsis leidyi]
MARGLPLQMAKQHSLKARKYRWLERGMFSSLILLCGAATFYLNFYENWDLSNTTRELEKKMGGLSKRFWRTWYWITEVESSAKTEDMILQCYREVEEQRLRESVLLREVERMEQSEEKE